MSESKIEIINGIKCVRVDQFVARFQPDNKLKGYCNYCPLQHGGVHGCSSKCGDGFVFVPLEQAVTMLLTQ